MEFQEKLIHGRLIKRYKRFLADVILDNGEK
jgi:sugar fermentation stimulation protein A